ncbi:hypothetical protein PoB_003027400 [Plakobranchus ocellatus]|uniref:Uncharacterized protein n=1 Tax=Plakobranchus ocellatus TaxID=259542 RepID=A0AAV4A826_9GAST|nr:hypothetical protein PoB_003027400 [Plakobranchus ocellatus]
MTCRVASSVCANKTGLVVRATTVTRIMRGHVMADPFLLSDRASDVRTGCKTQRIAPTLRQVADLVCIVGHVNCCLQCGPTLIATSVLRVSHDKSRRLQCGPTLTVARKPSNVEARFDFTDTETEGKNLQPKSRDSLYCLTKPRTMYNHRALGCGAEPDTLWYKLVNPVETVDNTT